MTGVWRAQITRVKGGRPHVSIPRLSGELEYGPLEWAGGGPWTAPPADPNDVGARVLVAFIEGRSGDPVVLGRLS